MTLPLYQGAKKKFTKDYTGVIAKKVKINVKLVETTIKYGKKVHRSIQLRFIDSCTFIASSLHMLAN